MLLVKSLVMSALQYGIPISISVFFFQKHLGFTNVLADKLHVFHHFPGNLGNLMEMFFSTSVLQSCGVVCLNFLHSVKKTALL